MKNILLLAVAVTCLYGCKSNSYTFELSSTTASSMCIIGKGPGQDGAINPYAGEKSRAVVKNLGDERIGVRVQRKGEVVKMQSVAPKEKVVVVLEKDYVLYLDAENVEGKAQVVFQRGKHQTKR